MMPLRRLLATAIVCMLSSLREAAAQSECFFVDRNKTDHRLFIFFFFARMYV